MDIRRFVLLLRQQFWLFAILTLSSISLFLLLPKFFSSTVYVSAAKILLTPSQRASIGADAYRGYDTGNWLADQQTLQELLTSERLLNRVCTTTNSRASWQDLRERVLVEPLAVDFARKVSLFSLSIQDPNPQQAQKLTEAAVQEFISYVEELSAREFANSRRFLEELVAEAKEKVDDSEDQLLSITSRHVDSTQAESMMSSLVSLDTDKRKVREDIAILEADLGGVQSYLSGQSSILPGNVIQRPDSSLTQMETSVATARMKLVELEQLYTSENVQVVEQKAKLQKLQSLFQSRMQDFASSVSQEKSRLLAERRKQLGSIEERMSEIRHQQLSPAEKRQVAKLERQLNMWEENHLNLVKQLYQARVVEQSSRRQGAITVLESPGPGILAKDKKSRTFGSRLALGLPLCIAFAMSVILGIDMLGTSLRLMPKVEAALGVPVLCVIPPVDPEIGELWETYKREETLGENLLDLLEEDPPPTT